MYYLFVAIFGGLGAFARYFISSVIPCTVFPFATLTVNLIGCFLLSFILSYLTDNSNIPGYITNGIGTGFAGAFTTFSAFSAETFFMLKNDQIWLAISYVGASVLGGLVFAALGGWLGDNFNIYKGEKTNVV